VPRDFNNQKFGELVHHIYNFRELGVLVIGLGDSQPPPGPHTQGYNPPPGPIDKNAVGGGGGKGGRNSPGITSGLETPRGLCASSCTLVRVRVCVSVGVPSSCVCVCLCASSCILVQILKKYAIY